MSLKLKEKTLYKTIKANRLCLEFDRVIILNTEHWSWQMNTSLNFSQIAGFLRTGNDISKLERRRKQSYSQQGDKPGDKREVLLVAAHKSQQIWASAFLCASEVVCRETGWGSRRHSVPPLSSSNLQLQCYTCPTSSGNAGMPFQGLFPKGIQNKKSDKFRLKNPCMGSGTQLGCFQTLVLSSRRKEFDSHIILFISNRSFLAFLISRLTKPMQRKFSPLI